VPIFVTKITSASVGDSETVFAVRGDDGSQLGAVLERRGLRPQFQRKKHKGKKMPGHSARGNATRARVRSRVEHVFAAQKCPRGLVLAWCAHA
jgi:hypothetical protein